MLVAIALIGVPPRILGPYIERRSSGHSPAIEYLGKLLSQQLMKRDRFGYQSEISRPLRIGAQAVAVSTNAPLAARTVLVASPAQAIAAIDVAAPGDVITFLPGTYQFHGSSIEVTRPGTESAPITVRAEFAGTVSLEFDLIEGFHVSAPYWSFENLRIRGSCNDHSSCEHAFHVVGKASYFSARNNTITDFNAHFKINGSNGQMPDYGRIESNTLTNSTGRRTDNPVTPIDLVAASHWMIRRNWIADFVKEGGDRTSYGGFAKGAGGGNRFEANLVLCELGLAGAPGQRVGLSLGGGGSAPKNFCRDGLCALEQENSFIVSNLIAFCSDDGIYINRGAGSHIRHNTLLDTGGITVRFAESIADVEGNLVDGAIRSRDGGFLEDTDNRATSLVKLYLGLHPLRRLFNDPRTLDLTWRGSGPRRTAAESVPIDLCGGERSHQPTYGAFEDFSGCLTKPGTPQ